MQDDSPLNRIRRAVAAEDEDALDALHAEGVDALPPEARRALGDAYEFLATHVQEDLACFKIDPRGAAARVAGLLAKRRALIPGDTESCDALEGDVLLQEAYALLATSADEARALAARARTIIEAMEKRGKADARDLIALGQAILLEGRRPAAEAVAHLRASYLREPQSWPLGVWLRAAEKDVAIAAGFDAFRDARLAEHPEEALHWVDACLRTVADPETAPAWKARLLRDAARTAGSRRPSTSWSAERAVEFGHLLGTLAGQLEDEAWLRAAVEFFDHARRQGDPDGFRTIYAAGALRLLGRREEALDLFRGRSSPEFLRASASFGAHYLEALWELPEAPRAEIERVAREAAVAAGGAYAFPYQSLARLRLLAGDAEGAIEELKRGAAARTWPLSAEDWIDGEGLESLRGHPRLGELTS